MEISEVSERLATAVQPLQRPSQESNFKPVKRSLQWQDVLLKALSTPSDLSAIKRSVKSYSPGEIYDDAIFLWYSLFIAGLPTPFNPNLRNYIYSLLQFKWTLTQRNRPPGPASIYTMGNKETGTISRAGIVTKVHLANESFTSREGKEYKRLVPAKDWFYGIEYPLEKPVKIGCDEVFFWLKYGGT